MELNCGKFEHKTMLAIQKWHEHPYQYLRSYCIGDNNGNFEKDPNEPRHFVIVGDCKWISGEEALEQVFVADDSSEDEHSAKFSAKSSEKSFG